MRKIAPERLNGLQFIRLSSLPFHQMVQLKDWLGEEEIFSIKGITIGNVINDIRAFCFHFITYFEPSMEKRDRKIIKRKTLNSRIQKRQKYKDFLNELKADENMTIPDSLDKI